MRGVLLFFLEHRDCGERWCIFPAQDEALRTLEMNERNDDAEGLSGAWRGSMCVGEKNVKEKESGSDEWGEGSYRNHTEKASW